MIFQDRELLRRRREESHQTVDDDRFYSKAALTLCFSYTSQDVVPFAAARRLRYSVCANAQPEG